MAGIGSHQSARMDSEEWLTPPHILNQILPFDLDPCAAVNQPWETAYHHLTKEDDGLYHQWKGHVFCNPPYGQKTAAWLERMVQHNNGIALIFARTETAMFHKWVWQQAEGILFLAGRLTFYRPDGTPAQHNAGGPSCLIAYGSLALEKLKRCTIKGHFINLNDTWSTG
jgi:hypothetical protein